MAECNHNDDDAPAGYLDRHEWAVRKTQTNEQILCEGCGRWRRWKKRKTPLTDKHMRSLFGPEWDAIKERVSEVTGHD